MSLRFAILGLLSTAPASGYDLARQADMGLGWFWSASHSQIYPELKRLEESGLIVGAVTTVGEKLEKRNYSITQAGLDELIAWVSSPPLYRANRDPERIQLIFSDLASVKTIREHLQSHIAQATERRDNVRQTRDAIAARAHARVEQRLQQRSPAAQALTLLLRELAYDGDVDRAELEIAWAERALRRLDDFERRYTPEDPSVPLS